MANIRRKRLMFRGCPTKLASRDFLRATMVGAPWGASVFGFLPSENPGGFISNVRDISSCAPTLVESLRCWSERAAPTDSRVRPRRLQHAERAATEHEKQGPVFWSGKNKGAEVLVFSSGKTDPDPELTVTVEVAETASEHNNRLRMAYLPKTASFHIHTNSKGPSAPAAQ